MSAPPCAYRAEAIAYCADPEPCMFHLGDSFALRAGDVQRWAAERASQIAASLGRHEPTTATQFLTWAHDVAGTRTRRLLQSGQAVFYTCTGADCLWELALRPVPHDPTPQAEKEATRKT
ncbi:hypothetical protein PJ985_08940 [Streptomyces sp. ACA25]|uniref:hypothetical protein n=1 Tax=Streptomyces sp. ACA25 TaxID=3022596 RepID=UPI0023072357|nr:hypothetical protein [Streptomyces sp. ACA25]MDB1087692.1 hypothetical protein [Streptomyces sp. ACA25]